MKNKALAAPYLVWMALFTIVPLAIVAYYAFTDASTGEFTLANLANLGNYMPILIKSIWLALISSLICIVIGYPVAYFIASCKETTQRFLYMLVMLPMCISFLLRTLAWVALTEDTGIINNFITSLGLQPLPLIRNNGAVVLGMVYNYLPYMIMPLYTVIMKIDRRLIEAAQDLGCNGVNVFRRVILPLSVPGIISQDKAERRTEVWVVRRFELAFDNVADERRSRRAELLRDIKRRDGGHKYHRRCSRALRWITTPSFLATAFCCRFC